MAKSLLSVTDFKHNDITRLVSKTLNKKEDLIVLLDNLQENGENIIQIRGDKLRLNLPEGYDVIANSVNDLIDLIINDTSLILYLKNLYEV